MFYSFIESIFFIHYQKLNRLTYWLCNHSLPEIDFINILTLCVIFWFGNMCFSFIILYNAWRPYWFWKTHCKKTPNYGINSTNSRVACACWMKSRQDKPYCQHCIDFRGGEPTLLVEPGTPSRMYVSGHFSWDQSWVSKYYSRSFDQC